MHNAAPTKGETYLAFDGIDDFVQIPSRPEYSVARRSALSVAAWIRVDALDFLKSENGYIHWLGKGQFYGDQKGDQEWVFRMYNSSHERSQRTSFYVFNPKGGLGVGSFVEREVKLGIWRHIVATVDARCTQLYCNGQLEDCDTYQGPQVGSCEIMRDCHGNQVEIFPRAGGAPLSIGTQNQRSFLQGGICKVRIWERTLQHSEIQSLYEADVVSNDGLVGEFLLNRDLGNLAFDSARGNHGLIEGATWAIQDE